MERKDSLQETERLESMIAALQQENKELQDRLNEQTEELEKLRAVAQALQDHFLKNGPAWQVERCVGCGKCDYVLLEDAMVKANILSRY